MAQAIKWVNGGTVNSTIINAQTLNAGSNLLSDVIDNATNRDRWLNLEQRCTFGTAPGDGEVIEVYIIYALDGSNYEDGDATPTDPRKPIAEVFSLRAVTTEQRQTITEIPIQPYKFKVLVKSEAAQNTAANEYHLKAWTTNEEVQ